MNYCPNCGESISKNDRFCSNCGTTLNEVVEVNKESKEVNKESKEINKESKESKEINHSVKLFKLKMLLKYSKRYIPILILIVVVIASLQLYSEHKKKVEEYKRQALIEKEENEKEAILEDAASKVEYKVQEIQQDLEGIATVYYDRETQTIEVSTDFELEDPSSSTNDNEMLAFINDYAEDAKELKEEVKEYSYNIEVYWKGNPSENYLTFIDGKAMGGSYISYLMVNSVSGLFSNNESIENSSTEENSLTESELQSLNKFAGKWKGEPIFTDMGGTPPPTFSYQVESNTISVGYNHDGYEDCSIDKVIEISDDVIAVVITNDNFSQGKATIRLRYNGNNTIRMNINEGVDDLTPQKNRQFLELKREQ